MLYRAFIRDLNKGAKQAIVAYDSPPARQGCQIYIKSANRTIFVPMKLIASYREELVEFLQTQILAGLPAVAHLRVVLHEGSLKLHNE